MARSSAYREAWAPPSKIHGDVINKQAEEDWTKYRALEYPSSDAEGKAAGTPNLNFSSAVRKEGAYPKNEARGSLSKRSLWNRAECQTELKALEKSTDAKIVRSVGFFFWKLS